MPFAGSPLRTAPATERRTVAARAAHEVFSYGDRVGLYLNSTRHPRSGHLVATLRNARELLDQSAVMLERSAAVLAR